MPIQTTKPTVVDATVEKTYDTVWMKRLVIESPDPNGEAKANVVLTHYREEEGEREEAPESSRIRFTIENIFANSEYDPVQVNTLMQLLAQCTSDQKLGLLNYIILDTIDMIATERDII